MEQHGIIRALAGMNVEIVEFASPVQKELACGLRVGVARESLDCDLLVNLPKIKAHSQMYVTLSVKNTFGIVLGMHKVMLHMTQGDSHRRFAELIVDLLALLLPLSSCHTPVNMLECKPDSWIQSVASSVRVG